MHTLIRHDDLNALRRKQFCIPELFRHGAWLTVPVGRRAEPVLGPSSTQMLLWLPVGAPDSRIAAGGPGGTSLTWAEVDAAIGAPGRSTSRTVLAEAMEVLLPAGDSLEKSVEGNQWIIYGTEYSAEMFGNVFWKHGWALGTRAGLLISLMNS